MAQDPVVREEARELLGGLFSDLGRRRSEGEGVGSLLGDLNLGEEFAELFAMPLELARIFAEMGFDIAELVLTSLAEAGIVLVRGITPA